MEKINDILQCLNISMEEVHRELSATPTILPFCEAKCMAPESALQAQLGQTPAHLTESRLRKKTFSTWANCLTR